MAAPQAIINGIVKNGLIVPFGDTKLPEGSHVEIRLTPAKMGDEYVEEFAAWEKLGDESWAMIDKWEKEETI